MNHLLSALLVLMLGIGSAYAVEPSASVSTDEERPAVNSDLRPSDEAEPPISQPASVEPAAGAEPETVSDDRDTTRELQQKMKLPRKN